MPLVALITLLGIAPRCNVLLCGFYGELYISKTSFSVISVCFWKNRKQYLDMPHPHIKSALSYGYVTYLISGDTPAMFKDQQVIPPYHFYWLIDQQ